MNAEVLDGHLGTSVTVDLCLPCHMIWFDGHESLQLAPGAVIKLFQTIGEQARPPAPMANDHPACPRCGLRLLFTVDQQRSTRFQYRRCARGHGRLITFVDFLREKDFIRPLSPQQIEELRQNVQTVNCSSCGAPLDLTKRTTCEHCGSPLSMLDMKQASALVSALRQAAAPRPVDPALPLEMERARREVEAAFADFERSPRWFDDVSRGGLVAAGLGSIARWLKDQL